jgi:hypothetical protein
MSLIILGRKWSQDWNPLFTKIDPFSWVFKGHTRTQKTWEPCPHHLSPRLPLKIHSKRGQFLQKGGFSLHEPILPTRSMWEFWASETLPGRLSDASVTLQKISTSGPHLLFDAFIHHGRFHGQRARCCGAPLARVRVCLATSRVRPLASDSASKLDIPLEIGQPSR